VVAVKVRNPVTGTGKAVLTLALLITLGYDAVQLGLSHLTRTDDANAVARTIVDARADHAAEQVALEAGLALARDRGLTYVNDTYRINLDGSVDIGFTVRAQRIILGRLDKGLSNYSVSGHADYHP
jgi:hypothetical protein